MCKVNNREQNVPCCSQCPVTHRFDVTMQEADRVDALYSFHDLATKTQGGADAEGSSGHTPPQICQVTALCCHKQDKSVFQNTENSSVIKFEQYWSYRLLVDAIIKLPCYFCSSQNVNTIQ